MNQKDNHPWQDINGGGRAKRGKPKGMGPPEIPVANILEAFQRSGLSKSELARRMGWMRCKPDIHRVSAVLGQESDGAGYLRRRLSYDLAVRLVKAMGASPFDAGV
jgi:plasmid maintenance system antidote protein VapI